MIVSWISLDNRKARRAKQARVRRRGVEPAIRRVSSKAVGDHIIALTSYLASPSKQHLDVLVAQETTHQHVVHYIGSHKPVDDPMSDEELARARDAADDERVLQILTRNLISHELADIQFEMAVIAGLAPAGEDPIEHIVLSWPSDEHPSPEQVDEALDILLAVCGMSRHQAYAVLHGDTQNIHLHVALNRVDPAKGERRQIGLDLERSVETLHQAVAIIEHRQGWASQQASLYRADATGCYERGSGIKVRDANFYPCVSDTDRKRIRALRAQDKAERKISPEAANYERRTGVQSIQRRVIETAAPILREAQNWDEVHHGLAIEGMRYVMLTSGAVIECGDRTISASTAWGGASAAKMVERLGTYPEPPADLDIAPFEERVIPTLHKAAEQRRARERMRASREALVESADGATRILSERYHAEVAADPRSDREDLNDARRDASAAVSSSRTALELLLASERARRKRRRARALGSLLDEFDEDEDGEQPAPRGMFIAADGRAAPLADASPLDEPFEITRLDDRNEYRRDNRLVFVEHAERIDLVAVDDASLRAALRIAHGKWGKVAAVGDRVFLDRVARIAVEEGIELTNPELQGQIARLQRNAELERRLKAIEIAREQSQLLPPTAQAIPPVLADYDPQFKQWLELQADPSVPRGRVDAAAMAIMVDPRLKLQLAELESQQFNFAVQLRRAGQRHVRARVAMSEQWAPHDDHRLDRPLEVSDLASSALLTAAIADGMVSLAPLPSASGSPTRQEGIGEEAALLRSQPLAALGSTEQPRVTATSEPPLDPELDLDRRYRAWAKRRRAEAIARFERDLAAALRMRVGEEAAPPRHIAMLLLREARRHASKRSPSAKQTDRRDAGEIAAMSRDPAFARMLAAARAGDPALLRRLDDCASGEGDALGRVPLARGRLQFGHESPHGHDPGARPPLEWIQQDLARLDFSRLRLTRHKGLVGVIDADLLEAVHFNYVGLLYPEVQAQLEVECRLQRERDLAALYRIRSGAVTVRATVQLDHRPHGSVQVIGGTAQAERGHIEGMANDAAALLDCRAAQRGNLEVRQPSAASTLIAAYLRAEEEAAEDLVLKLLLQRIRTSKRDMTDVANTDRRAIERAITPRLPVLATGGRKKGGCAQRATPKPLSGRGR